MRFTLSDARDSPLVAALFLLGLVAAVVGIVFGGDGWGAPAGSPRWLLGVGAAAVAIVATAASRLRHR